MFLIKTKIDLSSIAFWSFCFILSFFISLLMSMKWGQNLSFNEEKDSIYYRKYQANGTSLKGEEEDLKGKLFQKRTVEENIIKIDYGFVNLRNDAFRISYKISSKELEEYKKNYGYTQEDLNKLMIWQEQALKKAHETAVNEGMSQAQLNEMSKQIYQAYKKKYKDLLTSRGFKFIKSNFLSPDIPGLSKTNVNMVKDIAIAIQQSPTGNEYSSIDIVNTALSFVQTGIKYKNVPNQVEGRISAGVYPPLVTLTKGEGDCDSKSALLGAILLNWDKIKLIGLGVPNHYLMGFLQNPSKGEAFIEYEGLQYVLMEPAGPAWLPTGTISENTLALLNAGDGLSIEPITIN